MHKQRLLKLAALLEADAENNNGIKFDLEHWARPATFMGFRSVWFKKTKVEKIPVNCNMAACAIGLAVLSGAFHEDGLQGELRADGYLLPTYKGWSHWYAVRQFFGLDHSIADFLFHSDHYKVRKGKRAELAVAERIRDFVAGKTAP